MGVESSGRRGRMRGAGRDIEQDSSKNSKELKGKSKLEKVGKKNTGDGKKKPYLSQL